MSYWSRSPSLDRATKTKGLESSMLSERTQKEAKGRTKNGRTVRL